MVAGLVLLGVACEDTHILSGSFRSDAIVVADPFPSGAGAADAADDGSETLSPSQVAAAFGDLSLELVLRHFGPEVAGLVKFHKIRGGGLCPCVPLAEGRWSGRLFTFKFDAPFPADCAAIGSVHGNGSLVLRNDGVLDGLGAGWLDVSVAGLDLRLGLLLGRDKQAGDLNRLDLSCEGFAGTMP